MRDQTKERLALVGFFVCVILFVALQFFAHYAHGAEPKVIPATLNLTDAEAKAHLREVMATLEAGHELSSRENREDRNREVVARAGNVVKVAGYTPGDLESFGRAAGSVNWLVSQSSPVRACDATCGQHPAHNRITLAAGFSSKPFRARRRFR